MHSLHLNPQFEGAEHVLKSAIFRWSLLSGGHKDKFDRIPFSIGKASAAIDY